MKTFTTLVLLACAVTVTSGVMVVISDVHTALGRVTETVDMAQGTIAQADDVIAGLKAAAEKETRYYDQAARQSAGTIKAMRLLIDRTDKSLNDAKGTFAVLNAAIALSTADLDHASAFSEQELAKVSASAEVTLEALGHSADALTMQVNDEHIRETMVNLSQASANLDETLVHVQHMTAYYDDKLTKPATLMHKIGSALLEGAIDAGQFVRAFF